MWRGASSCNRESLVWAQHGGKMNNAKLRIAVLYDSWNEEADPIPEERPLPRGRKKRKKKVKDKSDREEIFDALKKLGHEPFYYLLDGHNQTLLALSRC